MLKSTVSSMSVSVCYPASLISSPNRSIEDFHSGASSIFPFEQGEIGVQHGKKIGSECLGQLVRGVSGSYCGFPAASSIVTIQGCK